jgi:hypothetical protein
LVETLFVASRKAAGESTAGRWYLGPTAQAGSSASAAQQKDERMK